MRLPPSRYSVWLEALDGLDHVWKSMDFSERCPAPSLCYREYLGFLLGTRLGLAVPSTRLLRDPRYGRISVQRFITGARPVTTAERDGLAGTPTGIRLLILDLICRNPDRTNANLLIRDGAVFPIDFNVAFDFQDDRLDDNKFRSFITHWFGPAGVVLLSPRDGDRLLLELERAAHLLGDSFLDHSVALVDDEFLAEEERVTLLDGLKRRRDILRPTLARWWEETVAPVHRILSLTTKDDRP